MKLPAALIFDYGRVLVGPLDRAAFDANLSALAAEHGFSSGRDLWNHIYVSETWEQAKRGLITHAAFWDERLRALGLTTAHAQRDFKAQLFEFWGLYPAMRDLLHDLCSHYRLAVLSNTARRDFAQYLADRRGLQGLFECAISSAEHGAAKPEPEIYRIALGCLDISPEQALFVDDQPRNTRAAEALGIASIVFTTPKALRSELQRRKIL